MILPRREFLRLLGLGAGAAGLGCGAYTWSVPDELVERARRGPGLETHRNTPCGLCEGGCGMTVRLVDGLPVGVKGNPRHPLNRGGLCPVGLAALDLLYAPARLTGPLRRGDDGSLAPVSWPQALAELATRLDELRASGRGDRIVFLSGEPSALFHELLVSFAAQLGSSNVARLADAAALPFTLMQGLEATPGFDLGRADLVLSFGLDVFEDGPAPVHAIVAMVGARTTEQRAALIHVGTRLSPSAAKAELRLPIQPGTHGAFALGVAHVLVREGLFDRRFVAEHVSGFEDWTDERGRRRLGFRRLLLERYYPDRVGRLCGCEAAQVVRAARRFASASAPVALAGGEATGGANGTWTAMAVHALNALAGAFDRDGGVVLPAAMALAPLAGPRPTTAARASLFAAVDETSLFGRDPVEAVARQIASASYPVEALIIVGGNPCHASPAGRLLREAMGRVPTTVVLAPFLDETASAAELVLPTSLFLEAWHDATTPPGVPFAVLGVGAPVLAPLHDTRHAGDVLLELARHAAGKGAAALPWPTYADYLKERVRGLFVAGQGAVVSGSFAESWAQFLEERGWRFLEHGSVDDAWDDLAREGGWWNPTRPRGDWDRLFRTASGRFEFFSPALEARLREIGKRASGPGRGDTDALAAGIAAAGLAAVGDEACLPHFEPPRAAGSGELWLVPFRTTTGRGGLGAAAPMVAEMFGYSVLSGWQTWAEMAPATAAGLGVHDGDLVAVESERGAIEAVVRVQAGTVPGAVHVPLGLGHGWAQEGGARADGNPVDILALVADTLSGRLALAATRVQVRLIERRRHGGPAPMHEGAA